MKFFKLKYFVASIVYVAITGIVLVSSNFLYLKYIFSNNLDSIFQPSLTTYLILFFVLGFGISHLYKKSKKKGKNYFFRALNFSILTTITLAPVFSLTILLKESIVDNIGIWNVFYFIDTTLIYTLLGVFVLIYVLECFKKYD